MKVAEIFTKDEVKSKLVSKEFSLRKRPVTVGDVEKDKHSAIWLYVSEILAVPDWQEVENTEL